MQTKFSEDVIPLSDLKINPGKVVVRANDTHRPIRQLREIILPRTESFI